MSEPTPSNAVITTRSTIQGSTKETEALVGKHIISTGLVRINREWQPKDRAAQRFKDDVIRKLEQVLNNVSLGSEGEGGGTQPDLVYDSGYWYFECDQSSTYIKTITHNMGQVPSRFTFFYANKSEPDPEQDDIRILAPGYVTNVDEVKADFSIVRSTTGFFCLLGGGASNPKIDGNNQIQIVISPYSIDGYGAYAIPPNVGGKYEGYMRVVMWR